MPVQTFSLPSDYLDDESPVSIIFVRPLFSLIPDRQIQLRGLTESSAWSRRSLTVADSHKQTPLNFHAIYAVKCRSYENPWNIYRKAAWHPKSN